LLENYLAPLTSDTPVVQDPAATTGAIKTYWKNGLFFESDDKRFKAKMGGRLYVDTAFIDTDDDYEAHTGMGKQEDGAELRAARWYLSGEIDEQIEFKWQYDFAGGTNNKFKDAYIGLKDVGIGALRVGQYREPFTLEEMTSLNHTTFMERSLMDNLSFKRNLGVMLYDANASQRFTWAAGVFREDGSDTGISQGDGEYALTGRITGLPIRSDDEHFVHLGAAYTMRAFRGNAYVVAAKPENNLTDAAANFSQSADDVQALGLEAAWVNGPISLQGEVVHTDVGADVSGEDDSTLLGYYAFVSYFITGESRAYKPAAGAFDRIKVDRPWGKDGGNGAWEIALRYSSLDLNDGNIPANGDELTGMTAGVNWYLNPFTRIMLNYIHSEMDDAVGNDGAADIVAMRFAIEF
jgi:phosphate-selective porin OprO/OprP